MIMRSIVKIITLAVALLAGGTRTDKNGSCCRLSVTRHSERLTSFSQPTIGVDLRKVDPRGRPLPILKRTQERREEENLLRALRGLRG
jgi:hypothetical protein